MNRKTMEYIAHKKQKPFEHLEGVAALAQKNAEKIGMGNYGELLGLLHDFGKYGADFQEYITDAINKNFRGSEARNKIWA